MKLTKAQRRVLTWGRSNGGHVPIPGRGYWPLYNGLRSRGLIDESRIMTDAGYRALETEDAK